MFLDKRYTDFLPIVLPTPERVADMLKGTSHDPDETVGKMSPTQTGTYFEDWTYTVRDVAVNAVMAGCRPEYFPSCLLWPPRERRRFRSPTTPSWAPWSSTGPSGTRSA